MMYAAAANRQKVRQVAPEAMVEPPPQRVRRPEFGDCWYPVAPDGRRPGDPIEALEFYTAPSKSVYKAAKPVRADDVPSRCRAKMSSSDETVRQRWNLRRAEANVRWCFNVATFCAFLGVVLGIIEAELLWAARNVPSFNTECLKWCILLSSFVGVAAVFEYGTWNVKLRRAQGDFVPEGERYFQSLLRCGIYWEVAAFMLLLCVLPIPSVNLYIHIWDAVKNEYINYTLDSCAVVLMLLLRLAFLVKCVVINDPLHAPHNALHAKSCNVDLSSRFILVVRLRESLLHVVGFWLISIFSLAYCMTIAERPHDGGQFLNDSDSQLGLFHNSLWLTTMTLSTVGYGDMYPQTVLGGLFTMVSCAVALVLVACTLHIVMHRVAMDDSRKRVLALTLLARHNTAVRRQAVRCIERLYLLSPVYRRLHSDALPRLQFGGRSAVKELQDAHHKSDLTVYTEHPYASHTFFVLHYSL
jgi:hypothetical protein